ncbi:uncharacterized protein LOC115542704 isoform X8 [Gadus morhua]|uniref:uncharacterized protein LOC115542704 isoform X8 n=1 Tax=Gadus morhua TaxID=8049 RepID=UPI0011B61B3C|nr:uncharacterized protein LOC115542704 isoform X8 [Gadus morhua]
MMAIAPKGMATTPSRLKTPHHHHSTHMMAIAPKGMATTPSRLKTPHHHHSTDMMAIAPKGMATTPSRLKTPHHHHSTDMMAIAPKGMATTPSRLKTPHPRHKWLRRIVAKIKGFSEYTRHWLANTRCSSKTGVRGPDCRRDDDGLLWEWQKIIILL